MNNPTKIFFIAALIGSVAGQLMLRLHHNSELPWWHVWPGAYAVLGVVSVIVLVALAKVLEAVLLKDDD